VILSDYYISKYPVTNEEYKAFVDATGHPVPHKKETWAEPYNWDRENRTYPAGRGKHPVVLVSYDDALAYCEWAKKRLPTEAEWEKAARGENGHIFPWGNKEPDENRCNYRANNRGTTDVDLFTNGVSPYGIMDMAGNVWEWCLDSYKKDFYQDPGHANDPKCTDPTGRIVIRGGCWANAPDMLRCTNRHSSEPDKRVVTIGFRTALDAK
jgi:serine/threonine-protein kinase